MIGDAIGLSLSSSVGLGLALGWPWVGLGLASDPDLGSLKFAEDVKSHGDDL